MVEADQRDQVEERDEHGERHREVDPEDSRTSHVITPTAAASVRLTVHVALDDPVDPLPDSPSAVAC